VAALLAISVPAAAQFANTASIEGTVTDESGGALPGVIVTVSSPALQVAQLSDVTNAEGHYRLTQLPRGAYQIRYELSGFQPVLREAIEVGAGFAAKIDITLKIGSVTETVTVSGASPIVDVTTTATGTTLSTDQVNKLLPSSRMYGDMSRMVPAMQTTSAPNIGRIGFGATGGYNAYGDTATTLRLDGLEVLGNTYPDFATAQEVEIKSAGTAPDVASPGAVWNLVLKAGGNQFHGRYGETYINGDLQSNNVDSLLTSQGLSNADSVVWFTDTTADIGGRVVPDKMWFYGAYRRRQNRRTAAGEVWQTDPTCGCVTDNTAYVAPDHQQNFTGRLSYQLSPKFQVIAMYAHDLSVNDGGVENNKGARRFVPYESDMYEIYDPYHWHLEFRGTLRDNVLFNVQGGYSHYTFSAYDTPADHSNSAKTAWFDRNTGYFGGGSIGPASNYAEYFDPHFIGWPVKASLTMLPHRHVAGGSHEITIGGSYRMNGAGGTAPSHAAGNYQITYDVVNGVPHQPVEIQTFNFPIYQPARENNGAGWVNDRYQIGRRMTFNVGLRFDHDHAFVPALSREAGQFAAAGSFPRFEGNTWNTLSPRTAVAYDATGDGKTVVKATYSRYANGVPDASPYSKAGVVATTYRFHDLNKDGMYQPGEVNLDPNGTDFLSITGNGVASNIYNPDLRRPIQHEVTMFFDREIRANMAAHVGYVYKRIVARTTTINALRPYSAFDIPLQRRDPGPDGNVNTADDGGMVTIWDYDAAYRGAAFVGNEVVNTPSSRADHYNTLEFTLTRRTSAKWGLSTSYLLRRNYQYLAPVPQSPNDDDFPIDDSSTWVYKINGSYRLPYDVMFSGLFDMQPPVKLQRTYIFRAADPLGGPALRQQSTVTLRLSSVGDYTAPMSRASANLRISKLFRVDRREAQVSLDLLNAFNSNAFWTVDARSGPTFGYGTAFTNPRTLQFGLAFEF
jgi:hypothetical protein